MTPLSDALVAAQSRAVAALGKQYVGGQLDSDAVRIALDGIGLNDPTDTERWLNALDILRETGAAIPSTNGATTEKQPEPATQAQRDLIKRLVVEKNVPAPDCEPMSKQDAHEIIDSLKAGSYDPQKWSIPF